MKKLSIILPIMALMAGCDNSASTATTTTQPITNQQPATQSLTAMIESISNKEFVLENAQQTLTFTQNEDKQNIIAGFAGLNRYFGDYSIENNQIKFGNLATTLMAGSPEDMEEEAKFLKLLATMNTIEIKDNVILLSNGKENLKFIAK